MMFDIVDSLYNDHFSFNEHIFLFAWCVEYTLFNLFKKVNKQH